MLDVFAARIVVTLLDIEAWSIFPSSSLSNFFLEAHARVLFLFYDWKRRQDWMSSLLFRVGNLSLVFNELYKIGLALLISILFDRLLNWWLCFQLSWSLES